MEKTIKITLILVSSFLVLLLIDGIVIANYSIQCEKLKDVNLIQNCKYNDMPLEYKVLMIIGILGGLFSMQIPFFSNMDSVKPFRHGVEHE